MPPGTYRGTWSEFFAPETRGGPITLTFAADGKVSGTSNIGNGESPVVGTTDEEGIPYLVIYLNPESSIACAPYGKFQVSRDGTRLKGPLKDNVGDFLADVQFDLVKVEQ